jgi:hypothetical protein
MTTLIIKDLAITEELDAAALSAVTGGTAARMPAGWMPFFGGQADISFNASQALGQTQNVVNNNGNNAAFVCGITSTVNPTQHGSNNISL